jgi:CIC family chloride channel protein
MTSGAPWLRPADTLEAALKAFDVSNLDRIVVLEGKGKDLTPAGWVYHVDALASFNRALVEQSKEEHV